MKLLIAGGCTYDEGQKQYQKQEYRLTLPTKGDIHHPYFQHSTHLESELHMRIFYLDVNGNAAGGQTIEAEVTASADFTLSGGTNKAGTYPAALAGITTIRPNVTDPTDSTLADGGRNGETFTITGTGFGTACAFHPRRVGTTTYLDL